MRFVPSLAVLALLSAASGIAAHADTISFGSYVGTTPPTGLSNTTITYDATASGTSEGQTTGNAVAYMNAAYAAPFAGTSYVSFSTNGGDGTGTTYYTTTISGPLANGSGTFSYYSDNSLGLTVNGHSVVANPDSVTYGAFEAPGMSAAIPLGDLVNGVNVFVFDVYNGGGPTAFDFSGSVNYTPTAPAVPEPSSMALLGTGLLSAAGFARRKFRRS